MRSVSDHVGEPRHAGPLDGADATGEARGAERLLVRVGLWCREGRVIRARWRASACASLIAYAEAACAALEGGLAPPRLDASALRERVAGVHPVHYDRADLVASAVRSASEALERGSP